jgi:D-sedoheptulose 7-phosphate isomerase
MKSLIVAEIKESVDVKRSILDNQKILNQIEIVVQSCLIALNNGGKIIFCGNGGSFADAQHLTAEFISRLRFDRAPLASIALGTNSSCMSAIGNDYGYEHVFKREIIGLGGSNDVFIPISTSGNSPNILAAIDAANDLKIPTFGFTGGDGGKMVSKCECLVMPSYRTEKIQECHIMVGHIICYLVEKNFFNNKDK